MATRAWSNLIGTLTFQRKSQEKPRVSPDPSSSSEGAGHETNWFHATPHVGYSRKYFLRKEFQSIFAQKYFTVKISRCMVHLSTLILPGSGMTCFGRVSTLSFTVDESGYIEGKNK